MDKKFKLTQIAVFNPHRLEDDVAKALFVVRTSLFRYIMDELNEETKDSIAQNHLIIAARGMGKTSLLKRIQIEIKETKLADNFIPILYQEEQYNITGLSDLWLNSLDKLADYFESLGREELVKKIDDKIEELQASQNEQDIYNTFMTFCDTLNKRPILLLDNIGLLFSGLDTDEKHTLRKILIEKKAPILVAANPTKVDEVLAYGAPFYDAFQIHYIKKLSDEELFIILNNLIELTQSEELEANIQSNQARIRVINKLTGGNPRTAVMLFKLIVKGFSNNLKDDLDALLDEVTPLYKARFEEELSKQAQVIMNAIANHWHPISIKKLGELTGLPNNKLQPQLNRLYKAGWIEKNKPKGKNTLYEVNERFFNFWYLMRQSNRRDKKQIIYLSYFLESLYTGETLNKNAQSLLNKKATNADQILSQLAIAQSVDADLRKQLIRNAEEDLAQITDRKEKQRLKKLINSLEHPDSNSKSEFSYLLKAMDFEREKDYIKAEEFYKAALEINPENHEIWNKLGVLCHYRLKDYKEAEKAYREALKNNSKYKHTWGNLGNLYQFHFKRYKESEEAYKEAIKINPEFEYAWNGLGILYQSSLNNYQESEKAYKEAIKINPKYESAWYGLGNLYQIYFSKYKESEQAYKKALKINSEFEYAWNGLGNLYQDYFKKYKEAEQAYKEALKINPEFLAAKHNLVFLLRDKLNKTAQAKELFYTIEDYKDDKNAYYLHLSLFGLYDNKDEEAKKNIVNALQLLDNNLPAGTQDDWWRYAAIVVRLNHQEWFLEILKDKGYDIVLAPYYEAVKTLSSTEDEREIYLSTKAVEIREAAYLVIEKIKQYL